MTGPLSAPEIVEEPVAESAALQLRLGEAHCADTCRWYHAPRLYLRMMGVVKGLQTDHAFLLDAFGRLAREGRTRVLVTGAADYGTLAYLTAAYRSAGCPLEVTVLDVCRTPLDMNVWYAARVGLSIRAEQRSVLEFTTNEPFDVVCTHAFFGQIAPEDRRLLLQRWHDALRPGGAFVTAYRERRRSRDASDLEPFDAHFRERVRHWTEAGKHLDGIDPDTERAWVDEFLCRRATMWPYSTAELQQLFADARFDPIVFSSYPSQAGAGDGLRTSLVARRRWS